MLFRTHLVFAVLVIFFSYTLFDNFFLFSLFFILATFFVDIDSKNSRLGRLHIFRPFQFFFRHRGVTHSILFCIILSGLIFLVDSSAAFGFLLGSSLHLVLDCLSVSGVSLFWPFSKVRFRGFIKSGSILEEIIFVFVLVFDIYVVGRFIWESIFWTL